MLIHIHKKIITPYQKRQWREKLLREYVKKRRRLYPELFYCVIYLHRCDLRHTEPSKIEQHIRFSCFNKSSILLEWTFYLKIGFTSSWNITTHAFNYMLIIIAWKPLHSLTFKVKITISSLHTNTQLMLKCNYPFNQKRVIISHPTSFRNNVSF